MNSPYLWVEPFNFTQEQVKKWQDSLPQNKSVLRWVLENHKVTSEIFLAWAKKHYRLPVLKENFVLSKSVSEIRNRYANIWPDHVVPIHEWDGVLFLACLEPVENFQAPQQHQWVLASLPAILKLKEEEVTNHSASTVEGAAPAGLKLDLDNVKPPTFDAPAGLSVAPLKSHEFPKDMPAGLTPDLHTQKTLSIDVPEGLSLNSQPPKALPKDIPVGLSLTPPTPEPNDGSTRIIEMPMNLNSATSTSLTPPPIPTSTQPPPVPPAIRLMPVTSNAMPAVPPTPPPIGHLPESGVRSFEEVGAFALSELKSQFDKSMVLLFNQGRLEPWKWSEGWQKNANQSPAIDLSSPSVFRIVNESKNSYHGHVIANNINDAFFAAWNAGQCPEHVTIVPILIGKQLSGMLLGSTTKQKGTSISLMNIERLGDKVAELLLKWGPSKAA